MDLVANQFADDLATDEYAYSSSREDTVMTLEEFLMSHRLGILLRRGPDRQGVR